MTVKELREWLEDKNQNAVVWFIRDGREFQYPDIGIMYIDDDKPVDDQPDLFNQGEL